MRTLTICFVREMGHWRCEVQIAGKVEPSAIFGCGQGIQPILSGLYAAQNYYDAIGALPERATVALPPTIAVCMPSGRTLTFTLTSVEQAIADVPEPL